MSSEANHSWLTASSKEAINAMYWNRIDRRKGHPFGCNDPNEWLRSGDGKKDLYSFSHIKTTANRVNRAGIFSGSIPTFPVPASRYPNAVIALRGRCPGLGGRETC
jgi:hypothetical protein